MDNAQMMSLKLIAGRDVINPDGESLGRIEDVMLDLGHGRVAYAVMSFGGFLGMGKKLFAVPWDALMQHESDDEVFVLDVTEDRLRDAQGFDPDNPPDMADREWLNDVYRHYGYEPYWVGGPMEAGMSMASTGIAATGVPPTGEAEAAAGATDRVEDDPRPWLGSDPGPGDAADAEMAAASADIAGDDLPPPPDTLTPDEELVRLGGDETRTPASGLGQGEGPDAEDKGTYGVARPNLGARPGHMDTADGDMTNDRDRDNEGEVLGKSEEARPEPPEGLPAERLEGQRPSGGSPSSLPRNIFEAREQADDRPSTLATDAGLYTGGPGFPADRGDVVEALEDAERRSEWDDVDDAGLEPRDDIRDIPMDHEGEEAADRAVNGEYEYEDSPGGALDSRRDADMNRGAMESDARRGGRVDDSGRG